MDYISLRKLYYQSDSDYEQAYQTRVHSPYTHRTDFLIRELNRPHAYPAFWGYPEELVTLLEEINTSSTSLVELMHQCPSVMIRDFCISCMVDEIQSTNEIEGVRSTRKQIQDVIQKQSIPSTYRHLISLVDKYQKIMEKQEISFETPQDIRTFYDSFALAEVIQEHEDHAPDGQIFRKGQVEIDTSTGKVKHQGVYPEAAIIVSMKQALHILHDRSIPFLVRLSVFHYLFEYIHPFYDGNGRTGRFIISYYLARKYAIPIAFQLSVIIKKHKSSYYKMFEETNAEWNRGELTGFILQFLQYIHQACLDTSHELRHKLDQLHTFAKVLDEKLQINDKTTKELYFILLQSAMFSDRGLTMEELTQSTGKSRMTIQNRLRQMDTRSILLEKDSKPYRYKLNLGFLLKS